MPNNISNNTTNKLIIIGLLFVLSISLHLPFAITNYFGEQDSARIALAIIKSFYNKLLNGDGYMPFSIPLYLKVFYLAITNNLIKITELPLVMTYISILASAVVTLCSFVIVLNITESMFAAVSSAIILQLNPSFWVNSIYGFPSIVAVAILMTSLSIFYTSWKYIGIKRYIIVTVSVIFYVISVLTKVDAVMATAAFCLPCFIYCKNYNQKILTSFMFVCLAIISFIIANKFALTMTTITKSSHQWNEWTSTYISDTLLQSIKNFFSNDNINVLKTSCGFFSIPIFAIAAYITTIKYNKMNISFWMTATILPLILFWGIMKGNSARHNLIPSIFMFIFLAIPLSFSIRKIWMFVLVIMCIGNYFMLPDSSSTVAPSGRLFSSAKLIYEQVEYLHDKGKELANLQQDKVAILGSGPAQPYFQYEIIMNKDLTFENFSVPEKDLHLLVMNKKNGGSKIYHMDYNPKKQEQIAKLIKEGFFVLQ